MESDINRLYTSLQKNYDVLKIKCDRQLDYINELMNVNKSMEIELLETKIKPEITQNKTEANTYKFERYFRWYFEIISKMILDGSFLETKNKTKTTMAYKMFEYKSFIQYASGFLDASEYKEFIQFGILFGIIFEDSNGKSIFSHTNMGRSVRVIRIRIEIIQFIKECMNI